MYVQTRNISIVTFNMHGFNQGLPAVRELCLRDKPDIFLLHEHWLLADNLNKFNQVFPNYCCFSSSAMTPISSY